MIDFWIEVVSDTMFTLIGLTLVLFSVSVTPSKTVLKVLLAELIDRPLTVASALVAAWVCAMLLSALDGSKVSADKPAASPLLPSVSVALTRKAFFAPLSVELITKREPEASFTTVAITPALAALILSRTWARVSVGEMVTSTAVLSGLAANVVWPAPQLPSSMRNVPLPTTEAVAGQAVEAIDCDAASCCTVRL